MDRKLQELIAKKINVYVFLINGVRLRGKITKHDNDFLILNDSIFVTRHAIASIVPEDSRATLFKDGTIKLEEYEESIAE